MSVHGVGGGPGPIDPSVIEEPPATAAPAAPAATPSRPAVTAVRTTTTAPAPAATTALAQIEVGALPDGTKVRLDPATGEFSAQAPGKPAQTGPAALYKAAELVAEGKVDFLASPALGASGRMALVRNLEQSIARSSAATPARLADLQARSGAATVGLALARRLPEGDPLRGRLVDAYVKQLGAETERGLKATSALNLEAAVKKGEVKLTSAQAADLAKAKEATLPTKPPYDGWFKGGKTDLNVKHFVMEHCWAQIIADHKQEGFKFDVDPNRADTVHATKTYTDPATGKKTTVKVDLFKISESERGQRTDGDLFKSMSDPNTDLEFYDGHSNLGGNVLGALRTAPRAQNGDKWVIDEMCRGKQVIADVYNRFPEAHYTTTTSPAYAVGPEFIHGLYDGIAKRQTYSQIWDGIGKPDRWSGQTMREAYISPDDPRLLQVRDLDKDGKVDLSALSGLDPLYNVGQAKLKESAPRFEPVATNVNPQDLPGEKIMRGVNFLNTILCYHLDEEEHPGGNDGRLPKAAPDNIYAGGWFKSDSDEIVKIEEKKVGNTTTYEVKVNTKYKDQDIDTLGAAIAYEVNKYLSTKKNGAYTENDKLRGVLLAGEYCAYMCDTYEEADAIVKGAAKKYGFNSKLTWDNLNAAIDADTKGYASPEAQRALKQKIGSADPNIG